MTNTAAAAAITTTTTLSFALTNEPPTCSPTGASGDQYSHYGLTEALGACAFYESTSAECVYYGYCGYVGYCTLEDFFLYLVEVEVTSSMGGYSCTTYMNATYGSSADCTWVDLYGMQDNYITLRGWENADFVVDNVNVDMDDSWGERGHLDNETLAWLFYQDEYAMFPQNQYNPNNANGSYYYWKKANDCARQDFGTGFTESDTFGAAYNAYAKSDGSFDDMNACEEAYVALYYFSGPGDYLTTNSSQTIWSIFKWINESAVGPGYLAFATAALDAFGFEIGTVNSWERIGALQFATGGVTQAFGTGMGLHQMDPYSIGTRAAVAPSDLFSATAHFNTPTTPTEIEGIASWTPFGKDYGGCTQYYKGCGPFVGNPDYLEINGTTSPYLPAFTAQESVNLLEIMSNTTASMCLYTARGLYEELAQQCAAYALTSSSPACHALLAELVDSYMANFTTSPLASLRNPDDKPLVAPACRYTLDEMFGDAGITYDNLIAASLFFHDWLGAEFALLGMFTELKGRENSGGLGGKDDSWWPYLHVNSDGVGETNSGLFTKRSILEILEGYNDTLAAASGVDYTGLSPSLAWSDEALSGEYFSTGTPYIRRGATEVLTRQDLNEDDDCNKAVYLNNVHFPDPSHEGYYLAKYGNTTPTWDGYDSCKVWRSAEAIDGSGKMGLAGQYHDFVPNYDEFARAEIGDYKHPDFSFYNSLAGRSMNFSYAETTTLKNSGGTKRVDCFRYEMDENWWWNDGTWDPTQMNDNNHKYRHYGT